MAAFRRAVELGARFIETDLQITRDVHVIAMHDLTLDRTTSGHGEVHLLPLNQIRMLDAGSWFGEREGKSFAGERVPTLVEILDFVIEKDIICYLEIKSGSAWGIEHTVVAGLRDRNASAQIVILSFDAATLNTVHRIDSTMMTGLLWESESNDLVEGTVRAGARQLVARGDLITPAVVERAHRAGLQVAAWTINEPEQMRQMIAADVDGILTDYPDRLLGILQEKQ
jgi:glycerophosphoryl diester phosphodiesterase